MIEIQHSNSTIRTFILFVQTAYAVLKYADAYFYRKCRLSIIKFIVLMTLFTNGTMTPSELAIWTNTERHNITTLINRLKKAGMINIERNHRDKRYLKITLTDEGKNALDEAIPVAREILDQVMLSLGGDETQLLEESLKYLRRNAVDGLRNLITTSSVFNRITAEPTPTY